MKSVSVGGCPCAPGSRLGIRISEFKKALAETPDALDGVSGLHFHIFFDKMFGDLKEAVEVIEAKFGEYFSRMKWINFGGGQKNVLGPLRLKEWQLNPQERKARDPGILERAARADATESRPWLLAASAAGFAIIALLIGVDVAGDWSAGSGRGHLLVELAVMALALAGTGALWGQLLSVRSRARLLARDLGEARADAVRWKGEAQEVLRGLGAAIDRQFERWGLSPAEREVALLLLKGLSHKEVAGLRNTSERTVRQQSLALYRKAGLSGRAELAAFFLEDLLLPER